MAATSTDVPEVFDEKEVEFTVHEKFIGDNVEKIVRFLLADDCARIGGCKPDVGIVCGTGLSHLSEHVTSKVTLKYTDIPNFPVSTVRGHAGELVFGELGGKRVVTARGRFHYYEGYTPAKVGSLIRVLAALGCRVLIVTNAAGGVNPSYNVGDIAMIDDHIFFPGVAGQHPLVGTNDDRFGVRFPPLSRAYDEDLQRIAMEAAVEVGAMERLRTGAVYACVSGPSYETPHEIQMLRTLGCDQVGMSTIQEVVVARHCGLRVLGLSVITNSCLGPDDDRSKRPTHTEVVEAGNSAGSVMQQLVQVAISKVDLASIPPTRAGLYFAKQVQTPVASNDGGEEESKVAPPQPVAVPDSPPSSKDGEGNGHSTATLLLLCAAVSAATAAAVSFALRR